MARLPVRQTSNPLPGLRPSPVGDLARYATLIPGLAEHSGTRDRGCRIGSTTGYRGRGGHQPPPRRGAGLHPGRRAVRRGDAGRPALSSLCLQNAINPQVSTVEAVSWTTPPRASRRD